MSKTDMGVYLLAGLCRILSNPKEETSVSRTSFKPKLFLPYDSLLSLDLQIEMV